MWKALVSCVTIDVWVKYRSQEQRWNLPSQRRVSGKSVSWQMNWQFMQSIPYWWMFHLTSEKGRIFEVRRLFFCKIFARGITRTCWSRSLIQLEDGGLNCPIIRAIFYSTTISASWRWLMPCSSGFWALDSSHLKSFGGSSLRSSSWYPQRWIILNTCSVESVVRN